MTGFAKDYMDAALENLEQAADRTDPASDSPEQQTARVQVDATLAVAAALGELRALLDDRLSG